MVMVKPPVFPAIMQNKRNGRVILGFREFNEDIVGCEINPPILCKYSRSISGLDRWIADRFTVIYDNNEK